MRKHETCTMRATGNCILRLPAGPNLVFDRRDVDYGLTAWRVSRRDSARDEVWPYPSMHASLARQVKTGAR
jgi:hypothetical protein